MSRKFSRGGELVRRGRPAVRSATGGGATAFVLVLASLALLGLSAVDHSGLREARWRMAEALAPAVEAVRQPMAPVHAFVRDAREAWGAREEVMRLREDNGKRLLPTAAAAAC